MMNVNVQYLGNAQFEVEARGHKVICDQPEANGGDNEGMTPPELLLAALGTCAGYYAAEYFKARKLSTDGLWVRVTADKVKGPARMDHFRIQIDMPTGADGQHIDGVTRAVEKCLVKNTLLATPSIELSVTAPAAV